MKIKYVIPVFAMALMSFSCGSEEGESEEGAETTAETVESDEVEQEVERVTGRLDAAAFKERMAEEGIQLIDVRTPGEVAAGAIDGSTNIDWNGNNFETEVEKLDKTKPVLVYCAAGGRSQQAMNKMIEMGFTEVYDLVDGYNGWPYKE